MRFIFDRTFLQFLLLVSSGVVTSGCLFESRLASEASLISVKEIRVAERQYFEVSGQTRYGTLKELADRKLIPDKLADGEDESFLFVLTTGENHYELTAKPVGIYAASLYVDETGVIRESENMTTIANRSSLPIKIQE